MEEEYINFGDELVNKLDLLKAIGDYKAYSSTQPWSAARRGAFDAVIELALNRGILGTRKYTNPDTGESMYYATFGGDPFDINTYDKNTRRGWQDAAGFIGRLAESLPTKKSIEEKKKKEEEERIAKLPTFDSNSFLSTLYKNISDKEFGGQAFDGKTFDMNRWNTLDDVRNEKTGAVGTDKRKEALAKYLEKIGENFKSEEYNWKDSPFKDADDFKSRLGEAVKALRSEDLNDDTPALNKLGINYKDWFNNRTGEVYTTDKQGNPITYGAYYRALLELKDVEAKDAAAKASAIRANQWKGFKSWNFSKFAGRPLTAEESNATYLDNLFAKGKWTPDENSLIVLAFKLAEKNGQLVGLSKEELAKLPSTWKNRGKYLRKINGLTSPFYYDTLTKQFKLFFKDDLDTKTSFLDILDLNNPENIAKKLKEQAAKNMNTPISQMTEWSPEMKKEMEAIGWDIASIIDPEAFSGSAMALYASHLRDEANPNRSTLEKWFDRGTAALGGIQGFGDLLVTGKLGYRLYQLGKSMGSVSKFAGMLGAGFGAIGAYEAKDSIMKLSNPSSLTPLDIENISYGFMGLIGLKSFAKARNKLTIGKQSNPTITEHNITIKDKSGTSHEIKIDETTSKDILLLRTFGKKKATIDSEILNMPKVKESIKKYKENNPTKKLEIEGASIVNDSKIGKNKVVTSKPVRDPNAPEYTPIGTKWYSPFGYMAQGNNKWGYYLGGGWQRKAWENAIPEQSSKGLWLRAKEFWSPEPKPILSESVKTPKSTTETPKTTPKTEQKPLSPEEIKQSRETLKEYKNYLSGKFSKDDILIGKLKVGDKEMTISSTTNKKNGKVTYDIHFGNKHLYNIKSLEQVKLKVFNLIKENRKQVDKSTGSVTRKSTKEIGKILQELKRKGWLKQGGTIDKQRIQRYKEFIKK